MKKILSLAIACVLILSLCACGKEDSTYKVGDTATVCGVDITFVGITDVGNGLVLCDFEIVNNTAEALIISSVLCFDAQADGKVCNPTLGIHEGKESLNGTIAAGQKLAGVAGFEVASGWKELQIQYKPYVLRDDKVTFTATSGK